VGPLSRAARCSRSGLRGVDRRPRGQASLIASSRERLPDGTVVVSPHLDDAVLSLGASIACTSRSGRRVTVVTVFAGTPESIAPAGGWDRRAGFSTEGEAVAARRREDREACALVGAEPRWLHFSDADYRPRLDPDEIGDAVCAAVGPATAVLLPGFPLTNDDHAWLARVLLERRRAFPQVGLYAEQPYRYAMGAGRLVDEAVGSVAGDARASWTHPAAGIADRRSKRRAILAYRSQTSLLGFTQRRGRKLTRMLWHELLHRGEAVAWLQPG
jgi:LmbE family N-acetylglucosaminyl deacetylase